MGERVKIGFVPAQRDPFDENWAAEMKKRVLKALEPICEENKIEIIHPDDVLTKKGLVRDDEDAEKVIRLFKEKEIDGIMIGTMTFGDERSAVSIAENMPGIPVLLFSTKEGLFTEDGNRRADAFCGTLSIASGLYRRKIPFTFLGNIFPEEEVFSKKVVEFACVCSAVRGFRGAGVGWR
jgi:L-fucose isomerase-like protein